MNMNGAVTTRSIAHIPQWKHIARELVGNVVSLSRKSSEEMIVKIGIKECSCVLVSIF